MTLLRLLAVFPTISIASRVFFSTRNIASGHVLSGSVQTLREGVVNCGSFRRKWKTGEREGGLRRLFVRSEGFNDRILKAARGDMVDQVPVWLFRQAGPYLPEYRKFKEDNHINFLDICRNPEFCAEVAMQPLRRYGLDAAILFSDILVVAEAMGMQVEFPKGKGITVVQPLETPTDIDRLIVDPAVAIKRLDYVIDALTTTKARLTQEGFNIPLLGFSGGPWTLFSYMTGDTIREGGRAERWVEDYPQETKQILRIIGDIVIAYLSRQIEAGADAVQVFESLAGQISAPTMLKIALPEMSRIAIELKKLYPNVPVMGFARGAGYANPTLQRAGYDVVTVDANIDRVEMRQALDESGWVTGRRATIQGNFDPNLLIDGDKEAIEEEAHNMVNDFGPRGLIGNLGGGLMGKEDPERVALFVQAVRSASMKAIKLGAGDKELTRTLGGPQ